MNYKNLSKVADSKLNKVSDGFKLSDLDKDQLSYVKEELKDSGFVIASESDVDSIILYDKNADIVDELEEEFPGIEELLPEEGRFVVFRFDEDEQTVSDVKAFKSFKDALDPEKGAFDIDLVE